MTVFGQPVSGCPKQSLAQGPGARSPRKRLPLDLYKSCVTMQVRSDWAECPTDSISIHSSYVGIFKFTQTLKQSPLFERSWDSFNPCVLMRFSRLLEGIEYPLRLLIHLFSDAFQRTANSISFIIASHKWRPFTH